MSQLISIIVPIYKVENYLSQCIESILSQTYQDIEILLIDDGSPDNCGAICDEYAKHDKRIRVFHVENKGAGAARNLGLENAKGEFISFVDSDDYVDNGFIEYLYNLLVENDCDVSYCAYRYVDEASGKSFPQKESGENIQSKILARNDAMKLALTMKNGMGMYLWNGLFRREILSRFDENHFIAEDQIFTVATLLKARYVAKGYSLRYSYRIRTGSSRSYNIAKRFADCKFALDQIGLLVSDCDESVIKAYERRCMLMYFRLLDEYSYSDGEKTLFLELRKCLKKSVITLYNNNLFSKFVAFLLSVNEQVYSCIFRLYHTIIK